VNADSRLVVQPVTASTQDSMLAPADAAVVISDLHVAYGQTVAVDDVSLSVVVDEIFGVLGPNGAGKTTTVECAIGLRVPDSGSIRVLGLDPVADREQLRLLVGAQLQTSALPAKLKVGEILALYRSFYPDPADVDELIDTLGLADKRDDYYRDLSGGQKQRLSIALALIGRPRLAVLDEMTTGLDPQARRDTWDLIEQVRQRGVTILLVTHFMEEAERLCDRVALLDRGRVVAVDSPQALSQRVAGAKQVSFQPSGPFDDGLLFELPDVTAVEHHGDRVLVRGSGDLVNVVILALNGINVTAHDVELATASLEDAFVALTGHRSNAAASAKAPETGTAALQAQRAAKPTAHRAKRAPVLPKTTPRSAFTKLVASETHLAWRQPVGLLLGLGLPILLLLIFGLLPAFHNRRASLGGLSYFDVYVPTIIALVIAALGFFSLPSPLATYREQGILRRLSTTPVPPAWVLGAQLAVQVAIAIASLTILMVVGTTGFGLNTPASLGGFTLTVVLSVTSVFAIGLLIAGASPTAVAAGAIGWAAFFPLMFFAGLWVPLQELPGVLRDISYYTPLGASVHALQESIQTGFPSAVPLLVLAAYTIAFGWLALRYFKWE
jgi:ABC-2 type transport system ATP-binding protein